MLVLSGEQRSPPLYPPGHCAGCLCFHANAFYSTACFQNTCQMAPHSTFSLPSLLPSHAALGTVHDQAIARVWCKPLARAFLIGRIISHSSVTCCTCIVISWPMSFCSALTLSLIVCVPPLMPTRVVRQSCDCLCWNGNFWHFGCFRRVLPVEQL